MAITFEALEGILSLRIGGWLSGLRDGRDALTKFTSDADKSFERIFRGGRRVIGVAGEIANGLQAAAVAAVTLVGATTKMASDVGEAANKFQVALGDSAEYTAKRLEIFGEKAGRSSFKLREMAADIGALLNPMGVTGQKLGEMSAGFSELAVDLSSFFNKSELQAAQALQSALIGETLPMRQFGVNINEAAIQSEALALGLAKTKEGITTAARAQSIYSLIMKQTAQAQGDAERTGNGFANQTRRLRDNVGDLGRAFGQAFLPGMTAGTITLNGLVDRLEVGTPAVANFIAEIASVENVNRVLDRLGDVAIRVGDGLGYAYDRGHVFWTDIQKALPKIQPVVDWLQQLWSGLPPGTQNLLAATFAVTGLGTAIQLLGGGIPVVGGLIAAAGSLLNPLSWLVRFTGLLTGGFDVLWGIVMLGTSTLGLLYTALTTIASAGLSPLLLLIGSVSGAFYLAWERSESFRKGIEQFVNFAEAAFSRATSAVMVFVAEALLTMGSWWDENGEKIQRTLVKWGELILRFATAVGQVLWPVLQEVFAFIGSVVISELERLLKIFSWILDGVEALADLFNGDFRRAIAFLNSTIGWLVQTLATLLRAFATYAEYLPGFGKEAAAGLNQAAQAMDTYADSLRVAAAETRRLVDAEDARKNRVAAARLYEKDRLAGEAKAKADYEAKLAKEAAAVAPKTHVVQPAGPAAASQTVFDKFVADQKAGATPGMTPVVGSSFTTTATGSGPVVGTTSLGGGGGGGVKKLTADQLGPSADAETAAYFGNLADMSVNEINQRIAKGLQDSKSANLGMRLLGLSTPEQQAGLVQLQRQWSGAMKNVRDSTGDARKANIDELKKIETAWAYAQEQIRAGSKKTVSQLVADSKQMGDAGVAGAKKSEAEQRRDRIAARKTAGGGGANSFSALGQMSSQLSGLFAGALSGIGSSLGAFNAIVETARSPLEKLDLMITQTQARLGGAEINQRITGAGSLMADALRNELKGLQGRRAKMLDELAKERQRNDENRDKAYQDRQRKKEADEAQRKKDADANAVTIGKLAGQGVTYNLYGVGDDREMVRRIDKEETRRGKDRRK